MTNPPRGGQGQPGQPNPYNPSQPPGQQGGYPQQPPQPNTGEQPTAGGYPSSGPQSQQPFGPQPGYGQAPFGQQPPYGGFNQNPYGQQQGFQQNPYGQTGYSQGYPPQQQKPNKGFIIGLIIAAVVVLAGGGVGLYFALSSEDKSSPSIATGTSSPATMTSGGTRSSTATSGTGSTGSGGSTGGTSADEGQMRQVAESFTKVWERDIRAGGSLSVDEYRPYVCASMAETMAKNKRTIEPISVTITVNSINTSSSVANISLQASGKPSENAQLKLTKENSAWKVCGIGQ